jgi:hypothetical protein
VLGWQRQHHDRAVARLKQRQAGGIDADDRQVEPTHPEHQLVIRPEHQELFHAHPPQRRAVLG